MELAEVADRLYAAPPEEFMALRTEQVKAAKAAGDRQSAREIGQLRKPTRSAWLVNLLARGAAEELAGLLDLGAALREAQENLDGAELRSLSAQRGMVVGALSRRAVELGAEAGYHATEAVRQEVSQTLQAAFADPDQADLLRRGVLSQAVSYGGFGPFDLVAPAPAKTAVTAKPAAAPAEDTEEPGAAEDAEDAKKAVDTEDAEDAEDAEGAEDAEDAEDAEQRAAREAARTAWQQARDDLAAAQADAEQATEEADSLADQVEDLRRRLAAAESAEEEARRAARLARKRVEELGEAERGARQLADEMPEPTR